MIPDFAAQRVKMVDGQVRPTDVTSVPLIDAMLGVPREEFVPEARRQLAYIDEDILIAGGEAGAPRRFLMEPSPFARLVQLAEVRPGDAVLDIGAGTGYAAAVLSRLAGSVVALESDPALTRLASEMAARFGLGNVTVVEGPLEGGWPDKAPYDVVLLGGAVDHVPQAILDQLGEGGRLAAVIGEGNTGSAHLFVHENGTVSPRRAFNAAVRPLPGFERVASFEF